MRKVLITGFDPFGGETINPAFEAVKLLPDQILDAQIIKLEVPTVFGKGPQKTVEAIEKNGRTSCCASDRPADVPS